MNDGLQALQVQLRRQLQTAWEGRRLAVATAWVFGLLLIPAVMFAPNRFEASARIYVDTQTVLKPLMAGLTYQPDIEQQLRMLARTVISRPNVERLVDRGEIGLATGSPAVRERTVTRLMNEIKINASGTGNLYVITYKDTDPARARRVVEAALDLFVSTGASGKRRDSEEAGQFIEDQIKDYEAKLINAENRLKEFKLKNFGATGLSDQDYFARVSALTEEVNKLRVDLNAAEQSRDAYRRELSGESPQLPVEGTKVASSPAIAELDGRLEAQKKLLDELLRRYTEQHPDVASTRRTIAQIEGQRRQELEAQTRAASLGGVPANAATSPVYQRLRIALAETEAQVASLRSQLGAKQTRLNEVRAVAGRVPLVEAEFAQLNRDYDIIRKKYDELVNRRESASLAVKLDESSRLAEFRVIEPPRVPPSPVFPGRLHLAAAAMLLALVAGACAPLVVATVKPTFRDMKALQAATGRPVLGRISATMTQEARARLRTSDLRLVFAMSAFVLVQIVWLAWLAIKPPL